MSRPGIGLEPPCETGSQASLWKHAANRVANQSLRPRRHNLARRDFLESPWVPRIVTIKFLVKFLAGEGNLFGIDDNQAVPVINMRRIVGRASSCQNPRGAGRQPAQHLTFSVEHSPSYRPSPRFRKISRQSTLRLNLVSENSIFTGNYRCLSTKFSYFALWNVAPTPRPKSPTARDWATIDRNVIHFRLDDADLFASRSGAGRPSS